MLYVALVLHAPTREQVEQNNTPGHFGREPRIHRRSLRHIIAWLEENRRLDQLLCRIKRFNAAHCDHYTRDSIIQGIYGYF